MPTIHDDIDGLLAADLHGELNTAERESLHSHLVECVVCRKLHQETKIMNNMLQENLSSEKPDNAFENRLISRFRRSASQRSGIISRMLIALRGRPMQFAAATCLILLLVGLGRWLTHPASLASLGNEELAVRAVPEQGSLGGLREQLGTKEIELKRSAHLGNWLPSFLPAPAFTPNGTDQDRFG